MHTRIVTISHAWGAGGDSVGRAIAERLDFRYVNEEVITVVAERHGLDAAIVADAERRRGFLDRISVELGGFGQPSGGEGRGVLVSDLNALNNRADVRALIVDAIKDIAERGDVVIVAHAASIPLAGRIDLLRVLVTASDEVRVKRLSAGTDGDVKSAARFMEDSDAARADYFRRFYQIQRELPTHYDLVVNTDALELDEAADIVVAAARRRG